MIEDVLDLMEMSEFHQQYDVEDIERLIIPAILNNRCIVIYDDEQTPIGMFTYTWLNEEAEEGYLEGTRKLQPVDWETDPEHGKTVRHRLYRAI